MEKAVSEAMVVPLRTAELEESMEAVKRVSPDRLKAIVCKEIVI